MPDRNVHTPIRPTDLRLRRLGLATIGTATLLAFVIAGASFSKPPQKSKASGSSTTTKDNAMANTGKAAQPQLAGDNTPLTQEQKILHILNRMGYGPRPGDVARVQAIGLHQYIEQQLNPEKINDSAVDTKLAGLTIIRQPASDLAAAYAMRRNKVTKALRVKVTPNTAAMPMDPNLSGAATMPGSPAMPQMNPETKAEDRRAKLASLTPDQRDTVREAMMAQQQVRQGGTQLALDKTVRAAESERQFQEVMVDFWSNHFNIDIRKNACAAYKISDERDTIRPHVFGTFRELLGASAHSPAMMIYLDNAQSQAPQPDTPQLQRRQQARRAMLTRMMPAANPNAAQVIPVKKAQTRGVNENYAREIMELHTLGVDGGYTQKDVQEVARCFTGWTVNRQEGSFQFTPRRHDTGEKVVLGQTIPAGGGEADGEKVLDILASHPSTMRFISTELCKRLVSDEPPASLIDKCVATWKTTNGDLRSVYRTIVTSPEFFSRAAYHQKVKSPFEYAISSVRALGATFDLGEIEDGMPRFRLVAAKNGGKRPVNPNQGRTIAGQVGTMGQPLYQYQAPTGYSEDSRKWVSSGALISRLNFALTLVGGKLIDVSVPQPPAAASPAARVNQLADSLLNGEITPSTRATLLKQTTTEPGNPTVAQTTNLDARLTALVLGSPEFQRR